MLELLLEIITVNHPPYRCTALISLRIPFDTTNPFFFSRCWSQWPWGTCSQWRNPVKIIHIKALQFNSGLSNCSYSLSDNHKKSQCKVNVKISGSFNCRKGPYSGWDALQINPCTTKTWYVQRESESEIRDYKQWIFKAVPLGEARRRWWCLLQQLLAVTPIHPNQPIEAQVWGPPSPQIFPFYKRNCCKTGSQLITTSENIPFLWVIVSIWARVHTHTQSQSRIAALVEVAEKVIENQYQTLLSKFTRMPRITEAQRRKKIHKCIEKACQNSW